jgi:hypothetical protein
MRCKSRRLKKWDGMNEWVGKRREKSLQETRRRLGEKASASSSFHLLLICIISIFSFAVVLHSFSQPNNSFSRAITSEAETFITKESTMRESERVERLLYEMKERWDDVERDVDAHPSEHSCLFLSELKAWKGDNNSFILCRHIFLCNDSWCSCLSIDVKNSCDSTAKRRSTS